MTGVRSNSDSSFQAPNHRIATRGLRARFFPSWASILDSIGGTNPRHLACFTSARNSGDVPRGNGQKKNEEKNKNNNIIRK